MTTWVCGVCGTGFKRSGKRTYSYCSPACRGAARRTPDAERRVLACEVCGASFTRRGTRPYRFCSVTCRSIGQRPKRSSPDELREMYVDQGLTANDIARLVGRDAKTIWSWLRAAGIETRSRGSYEAQRFKPGQSSAFKGMNHSPETKAAIRAASIADGRVPYMRNGQHWLKGVTGAAHPLWKGGITPERQAFYSTDEWKEAVRDVWVRDRACQRCGCRPPRHGPRHQRGHVHHIVSFRVRELRLARSNLILLCAECHRWVHSRANETQEYIA